MLREEGCGFDMVKGETRVGILLVGCICPRWWADICRIG